MKKTVFICVIMLVIGLNVCSCTPQPLLENTTEQATGDENTNGEVDPT